MKDTKGRSNHEQAAWVSVLVGGIALSLLLSTLLVLDRMDWPRFLLEMPTEYVEVQPDAIGRILNDYPGLAGSHRLAFDGERFGTVRPHWFVAP